MKHLAAVLALSLCPTALSGYSVLAHENIIDAAWDGSIQPLLRGRFPQATPEDLRKAHAFAYGGAIIQDAGYYPFGNRLFSDLTHYVRSGDFVIYLIRESQDLNEYAFALGALSHYLADTEGHPVGTNRCVPILFPKLARKYGPVVTYEQDKSAHLRTEFAFDVLQVAKGHYVSQAYHDFIGFEVSKPVLERAFQQTYGIALKDIMHNEDLALGTYRYAISALVPEMTRVAWTTHRKELQKEDPKLGRRKFLYNISRARYQKDFGTNYRRPGFGTRLLAYILRILPKVGPLRALAIPIPNTQVEGLFQQSFNEALDGYRGALHKVGATQLTLPDRNFDTGKPSRAGDYQMADDSYAKLMDQLAANGFRDCPADLRDNILSFYSNAEVEPKLHQELEQLKATPPAPKPVTD